MIGIDTNVLLRLIVRDDEAQARAAERFVTRHCSSERPGFVSLLVIAETAWALRRLYLYDRREIARAVGALLDVAELEFEAVEDVRHAVNDFLTGPAGFVDCLVARAHAARGCDYTVTFDRKAARLPGFKLLPRG